MNKPTMSKIGLIIGREFNQRVRKRTFILTTVLTPLLMVVLMVAPVLLNKVGGSRQLEILVLDRSGWIAKRRAAEVDAYRLVRRRARRTGKPVQLPGYR